MKDFKSITLLVLYMKNVEINNQDNLNEIFTGHFKQILGTCATHRADFHRVDIW